MTMRVHGTLEFQQFARRAKQLGSEGKGLLKELRRGLQEGAEPVAEDARKNVKALSSQARRSGSRAARTAFQLSRRRGAVGDRLKAKVHAGSGLRSTTARATKLTVRGGGANASAVIRVNTGQLPPDQRSLPGHMNTGRWRHQVMGNKKVWVTQTVSPKGWFDTAMRRGGPKARDHAFNTVDRLLARF